MSDIEITTAVIDTLEDVAMVTLLGTDGVATLIEVLFMDGTEVRGLFMPATEDFPFPDVMLEDE